MAQDIAREIISQSRLKDRPASVSLVFSSTAVPNRKMIVTAPVESGVKIIKLDAQTTNNSSMKIAFPADEDLAEASLCIVGFRDACPRVKNFKAALHNVGGDSEACVWYLCDTESDTDQKVKRLLKMLLASV